MSRLYAQIFIQSVLEFRQNVLRSAHTLCNNKSKLVSKLFGIYLNWKCLSIATKGCSIDCDHRVFEPMCRPMFEGKCSSVYIYRDEFESMIILTSKSTLNSWTRRLFMQFTRYTEFWTTKQKIRIDKQVHNLNIYIFKKHSRHLNWIFNRLLLSAHTAVCRRRESESAG